MYPVLAADFRCGALSPKGLHDDENLLFRGEYPAALAANVFDEGFC
jgi:hypothetical protein